MVATANLQHLDVSCLGLCSCICCSVRLRVRLCFVPISALILGTSAGTARDGQAIFNCQLPVSWLAVPVWCTSVQLSNARPCTTGGMHVHGSFVFSIHCNGLSCLCRAMYVIGAAAIPLRLRVDPRSPRSRTCDPPEQDKRREQGMRTTAARQLNIHIVRLDVV
jgi:hypothetical protein